MITCKVLEKDEELLGIINQHASVALRVRVECKTIVRKLEKRMSELRDGVDEVESCECGAPIGMDVSSERMEDATCTVENAGRILRRLQDQLPGSTESQGQRPRAVEI